MTEMWLCRKTANIYVKTKHFIQCVKDNDAQKTANIKMTMTPPKLQI
jgi:hypothetical protein